MEKKGKKGIDINSIAFFLPFYMGKPLTAERFQHEKLDPIHVTFAENTYLWEKNEAENPEDYSVRRKEMNHIGNKIFKKTISDGYGEPVAHGSMVTVHFTLYFRSDVMFSNSTQYCKPFSFVAGKGKTAGVLPGFELAIMSMKNQEVAHFVVPHKLLYGKRGLEPKIPPDEDGYLIAEVVRVADILNENTRINLGCNVTQAMNKVEEIREKAKAAFDAKFYRVAADKYFEAIRLLVNLIAQNDVDNNKRIVVLVQIYLYAGMAYNKNNQPHIAMDMMARAMDLVTEDMDLSAQFKGKFYLHAARTLGMCGRYQEAFVVIRKAKQILGDANTKEDYKNLYVAYKKTMKDKVDKDRTDMTDKDERNERRDKGVCRASFERLILSFLHNTQDTEKSRIMYAFLCEHYTEEVKSVASKFKMIQLKVENLEEEGPTRYIFTKQD
ncbi:hypothetical protein DMENIID0001_032020 [Sergentomyia squamirostris]